MKYIGTYSNDADIATKANVDAKQDKINVDGILMGDGTGAISAADKIEVELVELTKADVGLGNVDNTSDTNKPISNATQAALNGKVSSIVAKDASIVVDSSTVTQPKIGAQISATVNNNLKLNNDGLYSGEEVLVVHLSGTADALVADKTFQQIGQAMQANRVCAVVIDSAIQVAGANISPSTILSAANIDTNDVSGYKFSAAQLGLSGQIGLLTAFTTSNNVWSVSYSEVVKPLVVTFTAVSGQNYYTASETAENIGAAYISGRPVFAKHPTATFAPYASVNYVDSDNSDGGDVYQISFGFVVVHNNGKSDIAYEEIANTYLTPTQWYMSEATVSNPLVVTFSGISSFTSDISKEKIYNAWSSGRTVVCKLPANDTIMGRLVHAGKVGAGANDYVMQFEATVQFDKTFNVPSAIYIVWTNPGTDVWSTSRAAYPIMSTDTGGGIMSVANNRITNVPNPVDDTDAVNKQSLLSLIYPVGSIYMSVNSTSPQTFLGGTWENIQGRFLLGVGGGYTAGSTGGEATHTLTVDEMPKHTHNIRLGNDTSADTYRVARYIDVSSTWWSGTGNDKMTEEVGGGAAHNNMPPYLAVYIWKRTA